LTWRKSVEVSASADLRRTVSLVRRALAIFVRRVFLGPLEENNRADLCALRINHVEEVCILSPLPYRPAIREGGDIMSLAACFCQPCAGLTRRLAVSLYQLQTALSRPAAPEVESLGVSTSVRDRSFTGGPCLSGRVEWSKRLSNSWSSKPARPATKGLDERGQWSSISRPSCPLFDVPFCELNSPRGRLSLSIGTVLASSVAPTSSLRSSAWSRTTPHNLPVTVFAAGPPRYRP
jgi:hypothetical protein